MKLIAITSAAIAIVISFSIPASAQTQQLTSVLALHPVAPPISILLITE